MSFEKHYNYELSYNPYNFYYSTNRQDLPNEQACDELKEENENELLDCDSNVFAEKCYKHELCKNKHLANEMYERRFNHETSNASYDNLHLKYKYGLLKTVNLSVGIVGALVFIYYNNK
jgi:hypothetical protein